MPRQSVNHALPGRAAIAIMALFLMVALLVAGLMWYLSYGTSQAVPARAEVSGLAAPVEVRWYSEGAPLVTGADEEEFYATLGFIHGQQHSWSVTLWRQTALGRLAEWFGDDLARIDRHSRALGFKTRAQESFRDLSTSERHALKTYVSGLNAAFAQRSVRTSDELALLRIEPEPWEPWHPLAIERMMSWLSTPRLEIEDAPGVVRTSSERPAIAHDSLGFSPLYTSPPTDLLDFVRNDHLLRNWLHLSGFEHSLAWATQDAGQVRLYQRHTYGTSALPLFQDVVWEQRDGARLKLSTLPGTLMSPAGRSGEHAWALLLHGNTSFAWVSRDETHLVEVERIQSRDGGEHASHVRRLDDGRLLLNYSNNDHEPDSALVLHWPGISAGSDVASWRAMRIGTPASFELISGSGLFVERDVEPRVLGEPTVTLEHDGDILVGNGRWTHQTASQMIYTLEEGKRIDVADWGNRTSSAWAEETAGALVSMLDEHPFPSQTVLEALTYLRNWDYAYGRSSIAATIFDRWAARYKERYGTVPSMELAEGSWVDREQWYHMLEKTALELRETLGEDPSLWRWEDAAMQERMYPVWSADTLLTLPGRHRYISHQLPGEGHPSSSLWGPSALLSGMYPSATWEAWIEFDGHGTFLSRQHDVRRENLRARILRTKPKPDARPLRPATTRNRVTILIPAGHNAE